MNFFRKLYDWTLIKSKHPKAVWFLSLISFSESSFFPVPPDIILIPMIIAKKTNVAKFNIGTELRIIAGNSIRIIKNVLQTLCLLFFRFHCIFYIFDIFAFLICFVKFIAILYRFHVFFSTWVKYSSCCASKSQHQA